MIENKPELIFDQLNQTGLGYLTSHTFKDFLERNHFSPQASDIDHIMSRFQGQKADLDSFSHELQA